MGFEPTTPTLARLCSTPELHPHPRVVRRPSERLGITGPPPSYAKERIALQPRPSGTGQPHDATSRRNLTTTEIRVVGT
jgi:hypothetical protein